MKSTNINLDKKFVQRVRILALDCMDIAGNLAIGFRKNIDELKIWHKSDNSIVSEADIIIQREIIKKINKQFPTHRIQCEERFPRNEYQELEKADSDFIWIIDPIDGTRKFIQNDSNYYGTGIALLYKGHPVLANFFAPEYEIEERKGVLFEAYCDKNKAFLNGKKINVSNKLDLKNEEAIISRTIQEYIPDWKDMFFVRFSKVYTRTGSGSLSLCRVACSGVYPNPILYMFGKTDLWNTIIGSYIVIKSGGLCTDLYGNSIFPVENEFFENANTKQHSLIAGNTQIVKRFLNIIKGLERLT